MSDKVPDILPIQIDLHQVHRLINTELAGIDDPLPTELPKNINLQELRENITRWKKLRDTGCEHMQEFIHFVQSKGDAVWYSKGMLDGIAEIVDGGEKYDTEGKINPKRAEMLRTKFRQEEKVTN